MKLISYAQNNEDLMLWRALKNIEKGFYVDIGAADPVIDSVTKLFYDRGWSGINVEPDRKYFKCLKDMRHRDINLNFLIGNKKGSQKFFETSIRGWSSENEKIVHQVEKNGGTWLERNVECFHLSYILEKYAEGQEIHFLKIDVEGAEVSVINSIDLELHRPWIIVVEYVGCLENKSNIIPYLFKEHRYAQVYNDGLNLFFLAEERKDNLERCFHLPINIFDNYTTLRSTILEERIEESEALLESTLNERKEKEGELLEVRTHLESTLREHKKKEELFQLKIDELSRNEKQFELSFNFVKVFSLQCVKIILKSIYSWSKKSITFKKLIRFFEPISPSLFRRFLNVGRSQHLLSNREEDVEHKFFSRKLVGFEKGIANKKCIFLYVDHTCRFNHNTGVQQLVRQCLAALYQKDYTVIPVKWNAKNLRFQTLNASQLAVLVMYCHSLEEKHKSILSSLATNQIIEVLPEKLSLDFILVPEVTYINIEHKNLTNELIREAKRLNIKTSFVFYDDIPMHRDELKSMKETHADYMCDIHGADFIFPISDYSKERLIDFWAKNQVELAGSVIIKTIYLGNSFSSYNIINSNKIKKKARQYFESPFLLCVGSITKHKNQITLVRAFIKFKNKHPDYDLNLILVGHIANDIRCLIGQEIAKLSDVYIIEAPSNETIVAAYQSCLFSVFPSLTEGFGLPIIESIYFNKPCITASFGAMAEISTGGGCLQVNTNSVDDLAESIEHLALDKPYYEQLKAEATTRVVDDWSVYADKITQIWGSNVNQITQKVDKKRIFWLGMHKTLVETELPRLRDLGFEVFNPPYLANIADQSAHLDWDLSQETTLPTEVFDQLSKTNFFYIDQLSQDVTAILNEYFDCIIVTISPTWLAPILRQYQGSIIYRVYGQSFSITDEFRRLGLELLVRNNNNFHFVPHAIEAVDREADWLLNKAISVPYCLLDDVFSYADSWVESEAISGEVALTCPNITNSYYGEHYKLLKSHFNEPFYKLYGVQLDDHNDPAVVGTLPRYKLIESFRNSACYIYTYSDPNVCYLPPIEAMVIGLPVLFPRGCLLDKYFNGEETPARFSDFESCKNLVDEIRSGNTELINKIINKQRRIINRYKPSYVWPIFDDFFLKYVREL